jgi:hypothetical protein
MGLSFGGSKKQQQYWPAHGQKKAYNLKDAAGYVL